MKTVLFFLSTLICSGAWANNQCFDKLAEINKCWTEQRDIRTGNLPEYREMSERNWIGLHLRLVEEALRQRTTEKLNANQRKNRNHCLDILRRYRQAGNFPVNNEYAYRTPIFIDRQDNFCAVGFLLKETGYEHVSRKISAQTNLAYVREMDYPELGAWAAENGFSVDELAWIQPGYPPNTSSRNVGKGVDGIVRELYVDEKEEKMYVGGSFVQADGTITANSIAYVTESGGMYTWHNMREGVHGTVNAIVEHEGRIFVAGSFDLAGGKSAANIASWNGTDWTAAGCVEGTVLDLLVFEGTLYAAGDFKSCGTDTGRNFAKWDGSNWTMIGGISGRINTMEANGTSIVLGGAFHHDTASNVVQWSPSTSFVPFSGGIRNEVMDFDFYKDTLYAACKRVHEADTNEILVKLKGREWIRGLNGYPSEYDPFNMRHDRIVGFYTLCPASMTLNIGGYFNYTPMMGTGGSNCYSIGGKWSVVNNAVNKMVLFKKELYFGGAFKEGREFSSASGEGIVKDLNGIAKYADKPLSIEKVNEVKSMVNIFPNPVRQGAIIYVERTMDASDYSFCELTGKIITTGKLENEHTLPLPVVPTGIYLLNLSNERGEKFVRKITVQ